MKRNFSFAVNIVDVLYIFRVSQSDSSMTIDMFHDEDFLASMHSNRSDIGIGEVTEWAVGVLVKINNPEPTFKETQESLKSNSEHLSGMLSDYVKKYN